MIEILDNDCSLLKKYIQKSNTQKLLEAYFSLVVEKGDYQKHQEENALFMKFEEFQEYKRDYPLEMKYLEIRKEALERQNSDLYEELKQCKKENNGYREAVEGLRKSLEEQQEVEKIIRKELENLTMAAESQAKDLKDLHSSRNELMKNLEKEVLEKNQLQDMMLQEKIKISDQLNELNDLNESLQRQRRVLEQDQERFNSQYKDMQTSGKFVQLAPSASDAQLARNSVVDDIPSMVVRRIHKYHTVEIYDIAQNLNGSLIATCGGDRFIRLYDPFNLNMVSQMQTNSEEVITTLQFSPQQDSILMGSTDNTCQIFQLQGWKLKLRMAGHVDQVTSVAYLGGDKDSCVSGSKDRQIKLWNIHSSYCTRTISSGSQVISLASQHNVPIIISGHRDGSLRGYSMKSDPKPIFHEKALFEDSITSISMSGDNNQLLCCSKEGYFVKAFDLRMNKVCKVYEHDKYMNSYDHNKVCYGPDENFIVAGNSDGSLISWRKDGKFHKQLTKGQHEGVVLSVSYHPVSGQMYSADTRGNFVIWK